MRGQYEDRLKRASENVLETMEDLLLWSKSQMKNFSPQYHSIKIAPLLSQEIELAEEQINAKELVVQLDAAPGIVQHTDENFIAVILRNLLQNAIGQCDTKETIFIRADATSIAITNPIGNKTAADLNLVMQQGQVSSKPSGLGLQIVKDLATRLGIKILYHQTDMHSITAIVSWV